MKKKGILLAAVILLSTAGFVQAQESELGVTLDVTYVSKYIWRGIDKLDDKAALQPSINIDLYDTGFSFNVWSSFAGSSGTSTTSTVNAEEWRYILTYGDSLFDGENYKTNYAASWVYYDYPDMASKDADAQEFNVALSWPDICPGGIVPSYTIVYMWPAQGGGLARGYSGFIHVVGLSYDLTVPGLLPDTPEQVISLSAAATYNDGAVSEAVDHDWSHILWGISTSFDCGAGTLKPALYYQTSMDDSVNTEDEFFTGLSYTVSF